MKVFRCISLLFTILFCSSSAHAVSEQNGWSHHHLGGGEYMAMKLAENSGNTILYRCEKGNCFWQFYTRGRSTQEISIDLRIDIPEYRAEIHVVAIGPYVGLLLVGISGRAMTFEEFAVLADREGKTATIIATGTPEPNPLHLDVFDLTGATEAMRTTISLSKRATLNN